MVIRSPDTSSQVTLDLERNTLPAQRGDFLLSKNAVPDVNTIVTTRPETKNRQFHPNVLKSYLSFLELIVLNERLMVCDYDVFADLDSGLKDSNAFSRLFDEYHLVGDLDLEEEMLKTLNEQKILFDVQMKLEDFSPHSPLRLAT